MKKPCKLKAERAALINAIHRCHNDQHQAYFNYGARGIHVHDDWRCVIGFANFIEHIGPKPSPELTLDRIDNDKGYVPGNVRWATRKEQQANRRPVINYRTIANAPRNAEIVRRSAAGETSKVLGAAYGLTPHQITHILRQHRS